MNESIGDPVGVFLAYYDNYLRRNGLNDAAFAEMIHESEWTIRKVRDHSMEPPEKMLEVVGWCSFPHTYHKRVLVTETRYSPIEKAVLDE
ncbi:MAG: hypothetical protein CMI54_04745 [Parcubacteria group bacterium]|nr:hypothetical protein [Parcubacteria group bacterium]|tara:strand:+ start:36449 stop:36718 length:270 start_codon:yes stop_codon:yes gene_type:complete